MPFSPIKSMFLPGYRTLPIRYKVTPPTSGTTSLCKGKTFSDLTTGLRTTLGNFLDLVEGLTGFGQDVHLLTAGVSVAIGTSSLIPLKLLSSGTVSYVYLAEPIFIILFYQSISGFT